MTVPTVSSIGEHALIELITARLAMPPWVVVGPGDDAAAIEPVRGALDVLTTDAQVEGVHFDRAFVPPDAIGHRAMAVNLSDLAAMGAEPRAALLSLALPDSLEVADVDGLVTGLLALATTHRVTLIGGNITRTSGPSVINVTATGGVGRRQVLTRAGARAGDELYVTGAAGCAATGLAMLQRQWRGDDNAGNDAIRRYLYPLPRVRAGVLLARNRVASSCVDLSDGLADGIRQLARGSGVGVILDAAAIPIAAGTRHWHQREGGSALATALSGGDDYELLFTVRPQHRGRLRGVRRQLGELPITRIGVVTRQRELLVKDEVGTREIPGGYEHFR